MRWQPKDIRGERFGNLKVLEWIGRAVRIKKRNGQETWNGRWKCLCDCGNITFKRTTALNAKFGRSCGCLVKTKREFNMIGQRFGKLQVIEQRESLKYLKKKTATHKTAAARTWLCRCDCGNEITLTTNALRQDRKTNCGCDRKPHDLEILNRGLKIHRAKQRIEVYNRMRLKLRRHGMTLITTCADYIQWNRSYNSFRVQVKCSEGHEMNFTWARIHQDPECRVCTRERRLQKRYAVRRERKAERLAFRERQSAYQDLLRKREVERQLLEEEREKERQFELDRRESLKKILRKVPEESDTETQLPIGVTNG